MVLASGVMIAGAGTVMARDYEQPPYTVTAPHDTFEVRDYAPHLEARIRVAGDYTSAVSEGFRALAGYIFGGNSPGARIEMTTPVSAAAGTRIDMTAPVSASAADGSWSVAFMMPSPWTLQTLPRPDDPRIELVEVPGGRWAARTFSGRARNDRVRDELASLRQAVAAAGLEVTGAELVSQFDPPWTLGPWRRNEVLLPVRARGE